jgi:hypothetical protein
MKKILLGCWVLLTGTAVFAAQWHVYSTVVGGMTGNQQLTNAFAKAQSGDTITIHAGTYNLSTEELMFRYETADGALLADVGTALYSACDNLTVEGDPSAPRESIVLSGAGAKADGDGQHAIMRLAGANCTVRHLTFYRGCANSGGVIYREGQALNSESDKWVFRRGGGLHLTASSRCLDCFFEKCYAGHGAAICNGEEVRGCVFKNIGAVANNAGAAVYNVKNIHDSLFEETWRAAVRSCSGVLSNCVFRANRHNGGVGLMYYQTGAVVDCVFSNNTTACIYLHGANYMPREIRGCLFADNTCTTYPRSAGIAGSVACSKSVVDCTFVGDNQINDFAQKISRCRFVRERLSAHTVLSNCPQVEDCSFVSTLGFDGLALESVNGKSVNVVSNCVLSRCRFDGFSVRYGWVLFDVPRAENCLVERSVVWGYNHGGVFGYSAGHGGEIVNCTIVSNKCNSGFYNAGNERVTFRNTLFYNNKIGGEAWKKYDIQYIEGYGHETLQLDNCYYKANATLSGTGSINEYGNWDATPLFAIDVHPGQDHPHPYALMRKSPCVNAGATGAWTLADCDLAGNGRVNDIVDIGCYENWDRIPGLTLLLK